MKTRKPNTKDFTNVSRIRRMARDRVNRVAIQHNLGYSDMADLMGMPHQTVYHWMVPLDNAAAGFPRKSKLDAIHKALDDLAGKHDAPIARAPQLELPPTKPPRSMVDEAAVLLEGYRAGLIKSSAEEAAHLLDHYRNLLTKGQ